MIEEGRIVSNGRIAKDTFQMILECPEIASLARAGQFITLPRLHPLDVWRRAFTVYECSGKQITIVYRVVGENTRLYSELPAGEIIQVLGPGGQPVVIDQEIKLFLLVAGGCGLAPLRYIARTIADSTGAMMDVMAGFPVETNIFGVEEFEHLWLGKGGMKLATDDGSSGFHGNVANLFRNAVNAYLDEPKFWPKEMAVFTCGPRPMMQAVAEFSANLGIACTVLLEAKMACGGQGACLGCTIKTTTGLKQVCQDGPCFNGTEVIW